jgi:hypothetical protein
VLRTYLLPPHRTVLDMLHCCNAASSRGRPTDSRAVAAAGVEAEALCSSGWLTLRLLSMYVCWSTPGWKQAGGYRHNRLQCCLAAAADVAYLAAAAAGVAVLRLRGFQPGAFGGFGSPAADAAFDELARPVLASDAAQWCCRWEADF